MSWRRLWSPSGASAAEYLVLAGLLVAASTSGFVLLRQRGMVPAVDQLGKCIAGAVRGDSTACSPGDGQAHASGGAPASNSPGGTAGPSSALTSNCAGRGLIGKCGADALSAMGQVGSAVVLSNLPPEPPPGEVHTIDPMACAAQAAGVPGAILHGVLRMDGVPPRLPPDLARGLGIGPDTPPWVQVQKVAQYLKYLYQRYGDWNLALAAYQAGPGYVDKYGRVPPNAEVRQFIDRVLAEAQNWQPPAGLTCP